MQRIRSAWFGALAAVALVPGIAVAAPALHAVPPPAPHPVPPPAPRPVPRPVHDEQHEARREMRAGNVHSLRDIERSVVPTMGHMQYLGPEYDPEAMAYRLKFIRDGRVVFVDVDARTGQVLNRTP